MPSTRMGNLAVNRETWLKAQDYRRKRDSGKLDSRDLSMETLVGVVGFLVALVISFFA